MSVFIDTSAFYAIADAGDRCHARAKVSWAALVGDEPDLVTNNYVLLETATLLQNRLGLAALRAFEEDVVPLLTVQWISEDEHRIAVRTVLTASRRKLSIVDCTSFQTMRGAGIRRAFCFDDHFREQGFDVVS